MNSGIQLAKLTRPSLGSAFPRTRLFEPLDRPDVAPIIWVVGPPGSGKTTLIADYTTRRAIPCLWYQADRGDTDVASFFFYLAEAARQHTGTLPSYQPEYLGDVEAFARTFFRTLYTVCAPFLVFDNYQDIGANSAVHDVVRAALTELPDGGRVFVLSRSEPPPGFAALRARGRIEVIGWSELRLLPQECQGIAEARHVRLSEHDLQHLYARTQGWAAGVILLLQDRRAIASAGDAQPVATPPVIFDYLAEEIFKNLPIEAREFFLRAAYLPQITLSMGTGLGIALEEFATTLRDFARGEFLVTSMHAEPEPIFQFHPLLREFLLLRAEEAGSAAEIDARKRIAVTVLVRHGHVEPAAALLVRLQDWEGLATLIRAQAETLLHQGRGRTLEGWIQALPQDLRLADSWMLCWLAAARFPFAPREARELFADAFRRFTAAGAPQLDGLLTAINGALECILQDADDLALLDAWIKAVDKWARQISAWPTPALEARFTCNVFLALVMRQPDHPDLQLWLERTYRLSSLQTDPNVRISIDSILTVLSAWNGQFNRGERQIDVMRDVARTASISAISATKAAHAETLLYMLTGDRSRCVESAERGLKIVADSGVRLWSDTFLANILIAELGAGNLESAKNYLQLMEVRTVGRRFDMFLHAYGTAWYAMLLRDGFLAHQHLKTAARTASQVGIPFFQVAAGLATAHVLFDSGERQAAQRELERAAQITGRIRNRLLEYMVAMCRAQFALAGTDDAGALELLRAALQLGRDRNISFALWWQPQVVAQLCQRALEADIEREYVQRMIIRRELMPDPPPYHLATWPWRIRGYALGRFRIERTGFDSDAQPKGKGRPLQLLKALIAFGGQNVRAERLTDALWPHVDSDYGHRSLHTTLHRLRKLFSDESAVFLQAGELSLNRRLFWLDVWAFESACESCAAQLTARDAPPAGSALIRAARRVLECYRGPLLADDHDSAPWIIAPRERYRARLLRVLTDVCTYLEEHSLIDDAIDLYRAGVEREPLAEALYCRLMLSLKQAGRTTEAIEIYQRCFALLRAELHREPSARTKEVYAALDLA